jgi:hypothetical protein
MVPKIVVSMMIFCVLSMLLFVPVHGMESSSQHPFLAKIVAGDLAGVEEIVDSGQVDVKLFLSCYEKLGQLKNDIKLERDQEIVSSAKWIPLDNKLQQYDKIYTYLGNVGQDTLKGNKSQKTSPTASASQAPAVSSMDSSASCLAVSSFAAVSSSTAKLPDQSALDDIVEVSDQKSTSQTVFHVESASVPMSQTPLSILVPEQSGLCSIPEVSDEGSAVVTSTCSSSSMSSMSAQDQVQEPSAVVAPVDHRCNFFYSLMRAFVYVFTAAFMRKKSA